LRKSPEGKRDGLETVAFTMGRKRGGERTGGNGSFPSFRDQELSHSLHRWLGLYREAIGRGARADH
jgi:hypothetical protein